MGRQVRLCSLSELGPCEARRFEVQGKKIALVRIGDEVYAIANRCSHANYSLSEGEVLCEDRQIECWKHGSAFSLETGEALTLPATKPVATYDLEIFGDDVMVTLP